MERCKNIRRVAEVHEIHPEIQASRCDIAEEIEMSARTLVGESGLESGIGFHLHIL